MATLTKCRFCQLPMILKDPPVVTLQDLHTSIDPTPAWQLKFECTNCHAAYAGEISVVQRPTISEAQLKERMNEVSR